MSGVGARLIKVRGVNTMRWLLLFILTGFCMGCNESTDVNLHQAGTYQGKPDGMSQVQLEGLAQQKHEEILAARFAQVQTDR